MLFDLKEKKIKKYFSLLGSVMVGIVKCALKLFLRTFVSSGNQSKTANVQTSYLTEII